MAMVKSGGMRSLTITYVCSFVASDCHGRQSSCMQNAGTAGGSSTTFARPVPLTVGNSTNVVVENITEIASPFWVS